MRKRHEVPRRSPRLREFVAPPRAAGQHGGGSPGAAVWGSPSPSMLPRVRSDASGEGSIAAFPFTAAYR